MDEALEGSPVHTRQHGFRPDRSTETAISNMMNYVEKFVFNRRHCLGLFLDISSAFDTIKPEFIRKQLLKHGGDGQMVEWYFNYLTHRDLFFDIQGYKTSRTVDRGFPQGGVCSAKFWIVAFNEALILINQGSFFGNGFADDLGTVIGGFRLDLMMKQAHTSGQAGVMGNQLWTHLQR